eukprot:jgi/Botrbrau1/15631/Bobra.4_1s0016.1
MAVTEAVLTKGIVVPRLCNGRALPNTRQRLRVYAEPPVRSFDTGPTPTGASVPLPDPFDPVLPAPSPVKSYRVSMWDAMKFNAAPEIINGRLAMVGIVLGALEESKAGLTIVQQAQTRTIEILVVSMVIVYASLVPILNGAMREPFGKFTPRAEIINARAAMLGFGILLLLESKAKVPFF